MPIADETFQGVVCTLPTHHFEDLSAAFVLFTDKTGQMRCYCLNAYFPEAMARSMADMPRRGELESAPRAAGFMAPVFVPYDVTRDL